MHVGYGADPPGCLHLLRALNENLDDENLDNEKLDHETCLGHGRGGGGGAGGGDAHDAADTGATVQ